MRIVQRLIDLQTGGRALDIGCGAGYIAAGLEEPGWRTIALDVADYRTVHTPDFVLARSELLPFPSHTFSLVMSNHVIEHVSDPRVHLSEVHRVMAPGGVAYVATPNRLWILEPHYRLPLLSWLPQRLADRYLRLLRRGTSYDVSPLTRNGLLRLSEQAGLTCQDITHWVIAETGEVEGSWLASLVSRLPEQFLGRLSWVSPTFVFAMRRAHTSREEGPLG